jgi:hypothetical protein
MIHAVSFHLYSRLFSMNNRKNREWVVMNGAIARSFFTRPSKDFSMNNGKGQVMGSDGTVARPFFHPSF